MRRLIDLDKALAEAEDECRMSDDWKVSHEMMNVFKYQPIVKAIPVEQLLSILPEYDDYIHMKTYPHNEFMEDIYSKGYEDGWNVCLKIIKEELENWEKENENK